MPSTDQLSTKPAAHLPSLLLEPIADDLPSVLDYLSDLSTLLPHGVSQFGLVLTTALEKSESDENNGHIQAPTNDIALNPVKRPEDVEVDESEHISRFFRTIPMPVVLPAIDESSTMAVTTVVDLTISGHSSTLIARPESELMRAAATMATDVASDEDRARHATAQNFDLALAQHEDPRQQALIQGHRKNMEAVFKEALEQKWGSLDADQAAQTNDVNLYCVNDIWVSALESICVLDSGNRGVKFVISEDELLAMEPELISQCERLECEKGLTIGPMQEQDIQTMLDLNGVQYPLSYGYHIIRRSLAFRDRNNKVVAWAGSHSDFAIAALHVLPEYRSLGLGRLILQRLSLTHVRGARSLLEAHLKGPLDPSIKFYAHADCLDDNLPTIVFMERCGWHRYGYYFWRSVRPHSITKTK
ncbi:hypothetical protein BGW38_002949 [Lunasporangiospora selenospora]|uniref:N-acetyltransferase domain-containing protein n=1 Tax=Lunasporangiospora selenospora TaxID=979761 RepID=A0A9P6KI09_9FUNG|nr:hypothetical protein BGW38_002949 [Lunasporangiospora selenospora]